MQHGQFYGEGVQWITGETHSGAEGPFPQGEEIIENWPPTKRNSSLGLGAI